MACVAWTSVASLTASSAVGGSGTKIFAFSTTADCWTAGFDTQAVQQRAGGVLSVTLRSGRRQVTRHCHGLDLASERPDEVMSRSYLPQNLPD